MSINRNNYEEFFLLYIDNELSDAERNAVEAFVAANPDLGEELNMLKQTKLIPDHHLGFDRKQLLLKPTFENIINTANCEEYFLLYADDELNAYEKRVVEEFAAGNPLYQKELERLQRARLTADENVRFGNKEILYRRAAISRRTLVLWLGIPAAAAVLILFLITFITRLNHSAGTPAPELAGNKKVKVAPAHDDQKLKPTVTPQAVDTLNSKGELATHNKVEQNTGVREKIKPAPSKKEDAAVANLQKTNPQNLISANPEIMKIERTNPRPDQIAILPASQLNLHPGFQPDSLRRATDQKPESLAVAYAGQDNPEDISLMTFSTKKSRMRGVFRKVSRVFDKTTSVDDNKKSLSIGAFQIALK